MCRATRYSSIVSSNEEFGTLLQVLTQQQQPPPRKVRFSAEISTSAPSVLTNEEVKSLWYDKATISSFRAKARNIIFSPNGDAPQDETTRGLENCTLDRQLQRHRTIQCVISSYKKGMTPEQTALIAQRCSKWCRDLAVLQGCHDFSEVHHPGLFLPQICNTPPEFPFQLKRAASGEQPKRRVRRRVDRRSTL